MDAIRWGELMGTGLMASSRARSAAIALLTIAVMVLGTAGSADTTRRPITKKCVDGKQTEDPSSPPCIAYYEGDSTGSTWQGVSSDEIVLLIYQTAIRTVDGNGTEKTPPAGSYCDVDLMDCNGDGLTDNDPHTFLRIANAYSRYFNSRFQTYGRHVHAYMYFASGSATPASRRADAAGNWNRLRPFAVLDQALFRDHQDEYADAMAARNVMVFGDYSQLTRGFFQALDPMVWSYWPDVESGADLYAGYVCSKVAPTKVTTGEFAGQERKYALYRTTDRDSPGYSRQSELVRAKVQECGIDLADEDVFEFPYSGWSIDTGGDRSYALTNAAKMKTKGYNTILWAGGSEADTSKWADVLQYRPEWIVAGDGEIEGNGFGGSQGQASWSNAWVVSSRPRMHPPSDEPSHQAYKEAEPDGRDGNWAARFYPDWLLFFIAVQTAGPTLDPTNVELGLRSLAPGTSSNPYSPRGYFPDGDFSYAKDGYESWWDPATIGPRDSQGCYRLVDGGQRFTASSWASATDSGIGKRTDDGSPDGRERDPNRDPCTGYGAGGGIRAGIPFFED